MTSRRSFTVGLFHSFIAIAAGTPFRASISPANATPRQRIHLRSKYMNGVLEGLFLPGGGRSEWFKDLVDGPEMVVVPAGQFLMGTAKPPDGLKPTQLAVESPAHLVTIERPFAVGRFAITRNQYDAFVRASGHEPKPVDPDFKDIVDDLAVGAGLEPPTYDWRSPGFEQDGMHPVVNVSWLDANAYCAWLSAETGSNYRLLSEAEWEYVCRAGSVTDYWWGDDVSFDQARFNWSSYRSPEENRSNPDRDGTVSVDLYSANPWGLFQVHGNVWEWCEDLFHQSYLGAPDGGSAWLADGRRGLRIKRGGSWINGKLGLRSSHRVADFEDGYEPENGFRVARDL